MKIQVLHDRQGKISALFAPTDSARKGGLQSHDDLTLVETTAPDIQLPANADRQDPIAARLAHLMEHYEVRSGRLVERTSRSSS